MKDREKIAEIIKKNGTYNGRSLSFDYYVVQPDDRAAAETRLRELQDNGTD